jgi:hypothetical protein
MEREQAESSSVDNIANAKPPKVRKKEVDVLSDRERERQRLIQYLLSTQKQLEDGLAVDYNIRKESTLHMMLRVGGGGMHILVKTMADTTIVLQVELSDTIHNVKEKIQAMERIPILEQRYVFQGWQLDDRQTLAGCGVEKGSTLFLVVWSYLLRGNVVRSSYLAYVAYMRESTSSFPKFYSWYYNILLM